MGLSDDAMGMMNQEEAAAVKAQIVIKKGGKFRTEQQAASSPEDSIMSALGDMGISAEDQGDISSQFESALEATGAANTGPHVGYTDNEVIKVQVNPNSYSIQSKTSFKPAQSGGLKPDKGTFGTFNTPEPKTLVVKLYYDTTLQADYLEKVKGVAQETIQIFANPTNLLQTGMGLMNAYKKFSATEDLNKLYLEKLLGLTRTLDGLNTPPLISFEYGSTAFEGYASDVSVEFKRFNKAGEVIRAEVNLTMQESNMYAAQSGSSPTAAAKVPSIGGSSAASPNTTL